jgi:F0F1-type ATP synthase assembly protein I
MSDQQGDPRLTALAAPPVDDWGSASFHAEVGRVVSAGNDAAGFFASVVAGLLLGLGADRLFGTDPALVVVGILAGTGAGMWRVWRYLKGGEDAARR